MIDIENKVYNDVIKAVKQAHSRKCPSLSCYSEYVETPATFPCVTLVEDNNTRLSTTDDESLNEHYARIMYTCNIYTNNDNKKILAKSIANTVDDAMANIGLNRTFRAQIPNVDRTIYRIVIRYEGIVDEGKMVDGNKVHTIYKI